jgi:hypothetical protein
MLFGVAEQTRAGHVGYLAGRYRDGAYSDAWTDVARCAPGTFVAYAPACSCGWRGAAQPANAVGRITSQRAWAQDHLGGVVAEAVRSSRAWPAASTPVADRRVVRPPRPAC